MTKWTNRSCDLVVVEGDTSAGLSLAGAVARIVTGSLSVFGFVVPR